MSYIDRTESALNKSLYYKIKTGTNKANKETKAYTTPLLLELRVRYSDRLFKFNRNNKRVLRVNYIN
jgi:hypothetical protein